MGATARILVSCRINSRSLPSAWGNDISPHPLTAPTAYLPTDQSTTHLQKMACTGRLTYKLTKKLTISPQQNSHGFKILVRKKCCPSLLFYVNILYLFFYFSYFFLFWILKICQNSLLNVESSFPSLVCVRIRTRIGQRSGKNVAIAEPGSLSQISAQFHFHNTSGLIREYENETWKWNVYVM